MFVYLIWAIFGLLHFVGYLFLKDDPALEMVHRHSAVGLRNTLILLFIFQLLRLISVNFQHQEFVAVARSKTDTFDERRITIVDFLIFIIYFGVMLGLNMLS